MSQKQIIFPIDFNVKLLVFDLGERKWSEQLNDVQYLPASTNIIVGMSDELVRRELVTIYPVISNREPVEIRVVVTGLVYENETQTDECVGAFVDINIVP